MVYKRYIKQNGKTFGPYYYSSHRKDGKVVSKYLPEYEEKKSNLYDIFAIGFIFLFIMSIYLLTGLNYDQYNKDTKFVGQVVSDFSNQTTCTNCSLNINFNSYIVQTILLVFFFLIILFLGYSIKKRKEKNKINRISDMSYIYGKEESQKMIQKLLDK